MTVTFFMSHDSTLSGLVGLPFYFGERFSRTQAYIDLCILADTHGIVHVHQNVLAIRWGWHRHSVENFVDYLQNIGFIVKQKYKNATIKILCNGHIVDKSNQEDFGVGKPKTGTVSSERWTYLGHNVKSNKQDNIYKTKNNDGNGHIVDKTKCTSLRSGKPKTNVMSSDRWTYLGHDVNHASLFDVKDSLHKSTIVLYNIYIYNNIYKLLTNKHNVNNKHQGYNKHVSNKHVSKCNKHAVFQKHSVSNKHNTTLGYYLTPCNKHIISFDNNPDAEKKGARKITQSSKKVKDKINKRTKLTREQKLENAILREESRQHKAADGEHSAIMPIMIHLLCTQRTFSNYGALSEHINRNMRCAQTLRFYTPKQIATACVFAMGEAKQLGFPVVHLETVSKKMALCDKRSSNAKANEYIAAIVARYDIEKRTLHGRNSSLVVPPQNVGHTT